MAPEFASVSCYLSIAVHRPRNCRSEDVKAGLVAIFADSKIGATPHLPSMRLPSTSHGARKDRAALTEGRHANTVETDDSH